MLELLTKYQNGTCTDAEQEALEQWYNQLNIDNQSISDNHADEFTAIMLKEFREKLDQQAIVIPFYLKPLFRYTAAACIIFIIGFIGIYMYSTPSNKQEQGNTAIVNNDKIAPLNSKATITLANGQTILVDSIQNGTLANQGEVNVLKMDDGQIVYNGTSQQMEYNVLKNPRGSKVISLKLNDGSIVWLNSQSTLRFPVAFIGNERKVEITGEAYFEVAKNPNKKFIVTSNGVNTEVLGTHFNVNSYADSKNIKVTLLEGSVRISKDNNYNLLKPGQQALVADNIKVVNSVDLEGVMAWKNGFFSFNGTSVRELMNQLGRWYDIDIEYKGGIPERQFGGQISKSSNLSEVVKILNESGVKCGLENGVLIID